MCASRLGEGRRKRVREVVRGGARRARARRLERARQAASARAQPRARSAAARAAARTAGCAVARGDHRVGILCRELQRVCAREAELGVEAVDEELDCDGVDGVDSAELRERQEALAARLQRRGGAQGVADLAAARDEVEADGDDAVVIAKLLAAVARRTRRARVSLHLLRAQENAQHSLVDEAHLGRGGSQEVAAVRGPGAAHAEGRDGARADLVEGPALSRARAACALLPSKRAHAKEEEGGAARLRTRANRTRSATHSCLPA